MEEITELPLLFPRLRPAAPEFDAWADAVAAAQFEEALIEDGIALLPADERRRIELGYEEEFPRDWRILCAEVGGVEPARQAPVAGAVVAAIIERGPLDFELVDILEYAERDRSDFADTLATALEPGDLWSVDESRRASPATGITGV